MNYFELDSIIFLIISSLLYITSLYLNSNLASTNFEEILFYSLSLDVIVSHGDNKPVLIALKRCLPFLLLLPGLLYFLFFVINNLLQNSFYPLVFIQEHRKVIIIIILGLSMIAFFKSIGLLNYLYYYFQKSKIIEKNYIDPKKSKITFDKKKNLILIFVESLENTIFSKEHGGIWDYEIIDELYEILEDKDTINFFDSSNNQGMYMLQGASFTSSSVFANNSGIPIKMGLKRKGFNKKKYLNGIYNLGDVLKDNGYTNEVISAANTTYGGFKEFYQQHGKYNIVDIDSLNDFNIKIQDNDRSNWGINDKCLFEIAKKRLKTLAKSKKPFNLQLITIDTHFVDGYIGDYSETKFKKQYENAFATTSKLIKDFIDYLKKQPYYKDTSIIIVGDHLIMQSDFINDKKAKNRTIYNCFINSSNIKKKKRIYTALDMYPTILSSLGAKIPKNKLGLGVNLFSNTKTLAEKYGFKKLNNELKKRSSFYDKEILKKK